MSCEHPEQYRLRCRTLRLMPTSTPGFVVAISEAESMLVAQVESHWWQGQHGLHIA